MLDAKNSKNIKGPEKKYKILFENTKDIIVLLDKKGRIFDVNSAVKEISGYTPKEIKGHNFKELKFITPESKRRIAEYLRKRFRGIKVPTYYEIEGVTKNGKGLIAEVSAKPFIIGGKIVGSLAILRDVTEYRKTQEKFKLFFNAVKTSINAISINALNGKFIYVNSAFEKMFGYSFKELTKMTIPQVVPKEGLAKLMKEILPTIKKKGGYIGENWGLRKDGTKFQISMSTSLVKNEEGKSIATLGSFRDITEQKQIDQAKADFISIASHQLRTPLSIMNWYSEMLLTEKASKLNDQQRKYSEEIYAANQRLIELVNHLLTVSRIELGTLDIEPEPINLIEIADSVLSELSPQIQNKELKVEKNYGKNPLIINANQNIMRIVFQNLLSNAVKYISKGGRVKLLIKKQKPDVLIKVSDTGYGIPKAQQSQIFTKFFRADNIRKNEVDGTGLGLYIVKSALEQSGGKIWFESEENKGSTFYVTIPLEGMKKKKGKRERRD